MSQSTLLYWKSQVMWPGSSSGKAEDLIILFPCQCSNFTLHIYDNVGVYDNVGGIAHAFVHVWEKTKEK